MPRACACARPATLAALPPLHCGCRTPSFSLWLPHSLPFTVAAALTPVTVAPALPPMTVAAETHVVSGREGGSAADTCTRFSFLFPAYTDGEQHALRTFAHAALAAAGLRGSTQPGWRAPLPSVSLPPPPACAMDSALLPPSAAVPCPTAPPFHLQALPYPCLLSSLPGAAAPFPPPFSGQALPCPSPPLGCRHACRGAGGTGAQGGSASGRRAAGGPAGNRHPAPVHRRHPVNLPPGEARSSTLQHLESAQQLHSQASQSRASQGCRHALSGCNVRHPEAVAVMSGCGCGCNVRHPEAVAAMSGTRKLWLLQGLCHALKLCDRAADGVPSIHNTCPATAPYRWPAPYAAAADCIRPCEHARGWLRPP